MSSIQKIPNNFLDQQYICEIYISHNLEIKSGQYLRVKEALAHRPFLWVKWLGVVDNYVCKEDGTQYSTGIFLAFFLHNTIKMTTTMQSLQYLHSASTKIILHEVVDESVLT